MNKKFEHNPFLRKAVKYKRKSDNDSKIVTWLWAFLSYFPKLIRVGYLPAKFQNHNPFFSGLIKYITIQRKEKHLY